MQYAAIHCNIKISCFVGDICVILCSHTAPMKKALTIDQQIARLQDHGMKFDNIDKAKEILLDVGYYRFGFYTFPFEITFPQIHRRDHQLRPGTTFKSVYDLYEFDTRLRRVLLNALDRIEVNVRTHITYTASTAYVDYPVWYLDSRFVKQDFIDQFDEKVYKTLLENPIIKRHHQHYPNDRHAPVWKAMEFMTFGNITSLYRSIKDESLKRKIAARYGCSIGVFVNYLETIRVIRNKCAHGGCLFNIELPIGIKGRPANISADSRHNINGAISVIRYILGKISTARKSDLEDDIKRLLSAIKTPETQRVVFDCSKISL